MTAFAFVAAALAGAVFLAASILLGGKGKRAIAPGVALALFGAVGFFSLAFELLGGDLARSVVAFGAGSIGYVLTSS